MCRWTVSRALLTTPQELLEQIGLEPADARVGQQNVAREKRPAGDVDGRLREASRPSGPAPAVALDARAVAEGLGQRLSEGDPDVLDGVMAAGLQITVRGDLEVDQRVVRQEGQHVVEEPHTGRDLRQTRPVEVHACAHVGFTGDTL